jgi:hypothetical protein
MIERRDGPTPNGGAYAIAAFTRNGQPCSQDAATEVEITEYAADGVAICRTYARTDQGTALTDQPPGPAITSPSR